MIETDWAVAEAIVAAVLRANDGVARIDAFLAAGLSRHQVAAVFRRGVLERPRLAWYADPQLPWQAKQAIRVGGLLTCVSAAQTYGLPVPPEWWKVLHVRVAVNTPRLRHHHDRTWYVNAGEDAEVALHWVNLLEVPSSWRTAVIDTLVQLAECVPEDWFVAALDAALHRPRDAEPLLSEEEFAKLRNAVPPRHREALKLVDPRSESPIETLLRLEMIRRGIDVVDLQFVPHPKHRVDFLLRGKLIVEADGEEFHDPEQDAVRDAFLRTLGYRVLRFTYDEIVFHIDVVIEQILAALAAL